MSDTKPDADETRIRGILRERIDGYAPQPELPAVPPALPDGYQPAPDPDAWWDDLYPVEETKPAPEPEQRRPAPRMPDWWRRKPTDLAADEETTEEPDEDEEGEDTGPEPAPTRRPRKRRNTRPAYLDDRPPAPRQSLLDAYDRIPHRLKWLGYHATAAAAGWRLGWVNWSTNTAAWYTAGHWTTPTAFVLYGLGLCAYALYRRTRGAPWPIAWAAAVPVSSVVVGVLLYGTGYHR